MAQKVIICKGLPGSGKTFFAKNLCEKDPSYVRINRDDLRNMRGKYWLPKQEQMITCWQERLIDEIKNLGLNIIIDDTNLNPDVKNHWINYCRHIGVPYEFEIKDFTNVPIETCIERDLQRPNSVGEKVIRRMYNQYLKKDITVKQNPELPHAIICDLDGTLCLLNGRNPYNRDFINDKCNEVVRNILLKFRKEAQIFFFSGRSDKYKQETIEWLRKNDFETEKQENLGLNFPPIISTLVMRKDGDTRKDSIVKKEFFDQYIRDKYYVDCVLDDRNCVVQEVWRALGLTCLQVADGDF